MKKITILISIIFLIIAPLSAQKKSKKEKAKKEDTKTEISTETRKQSTIFADGLREFYSDNFIEAEKSFRAVILQNPKNDAAYFMLGKVKIAQSNFQEAEYFLIEARKIDPKNEWYLLEIAEIYDQLGDFKKSAKLWEEICVLKPDNEYYLIALSDAYLQLDRLTDVIKVYDRIEKVIGKNDEITAAKKNIYLHLNDIHSAVGEYEKLIRMYPHEVEYYIEAANIYSANNMNDKALPLYEEALMVDSKNPRLHIALIDYYKAIGRPEESEKYLMQAFHNTDFPMEKKLHYLQTLFEQYFKTHDETLLNKMEEISKILVSTNPEAYEGWSALGTVYSLQKNSAEAKNAFEQALSIHFGDYNVWENYMHLLFNAEDYQTIVNKSEEIFELFPTSALFLYMIGNAYYELDLDVDKMIGFLNQASMYAIDIPLIEMIYDLLGDIYDDEDNPEEAIKNWKKAIRRPGPNAQEIREKIADAEEELR